MLRNSRSQVSLYSESKSAKKCLKQDIQQHCQSILECLEEASRILTHHEFSSLFEKTLKTLIIKAEV